MWGPVDELGASSSAEPENGSFAKSIHSYVYTIHNYMKVQSFHNYEDEKFLYWKGVFPLFVCLLVFLRPFLLFKVFNQDIDSNISVKLSELNAYT